MDLENLLHQIKESEAAAQKFHEIEIHILSITDQATVYMEGVKERRHQI